MSIKAQTKDFLQQIAIVVMFIILMLFAIIFFAVQTFKSGDRSGIYDIKHSDNLEATIKTVHTDTTNLNRLFRVYNDTNNTVDPTNYTLNPINYTPNPAEVIILNELLDCMEDFSYCTVVLYEEF